MVEVFERVAHDVGYLFYLVFAAYDCEFVAYLELEAGEGEELGAGAADAGDVDSVHVTQLE